MNNLDGIIIKISGWDTAQFVESSQAYKKPLLQLWKARETAPCGDTYLKLSTKEVEARWSKVWNHPYLHWKFQTSPQCMKSYLKK